MIFYHPAFDAYHCIFRCILILDNMQPKWLERDRLRIFDFYVLFPKEITTITNLPQLLTKERAKFERYEQHEAISNPSSVFYQLEDVFNNTISALERFKIIKLDPETDRIQLLKENIPSDLRMNIERRKPDYAEVLDFLTAVLIPLPLNGPDGLKKKTHLLPFRYDRK